MAVKSRTKTSKSPASASLIKPSRTIRLPRLNIIYVLLTIIVIGAFILGLVLGILITKINYLEKGITTSSTETTAGSNSGSPIATTPVDVSQGNLPVLGNKDAKVKIIEFADFQCPFCERFFTEVVPNIKKDYVDKGLASFAFRHYAFLGQESTDAANASECANEQGKFWQYHDYLYEHQSGENQGTFAKDKLKEFALALGLNAEQFNTCLDSNKYQSNIDKDLEDGQKAGVDGTPATFVNGILISGALPYSEFKAQIEKALAN